MTEYDDTASPLKPFFDGIGYIKTLGLPLNLGHAENPSAVVEQNRFVKCILVTYALTFVLFTAQGVTMFVTVDKEDGSLTSLSWEEVFVDAERHGLSTWDLISINILMVFACSVPAVYYR